MRDELVELRTLIDAAVVPAEDKFLARIDDGPGEVHARRLLKDPGLAPWAL